jgi:hypothetical protein
MTDRTPTPPSAPHPLGSEPTPSRKAPKPPKPRKVEKRRKGRKG